MQENLRDSESEVAMETHKSVILRPPRGVQSVGAQREKGRGRLGARPARAFFRPAWYLSAPRLSLIF